MNKIFRPALMTALAAAMALAGCAGKRAAEFNTDPSQVKAGFYASGKALLVMALRHDAQGTAFGVPLPGTSLPATLRFRYDPPPGAAVDAAAPRDLEVDFCVNPCVLALPPGQYQAAELTIAEGDRTLRYDLKGASRGRIAGGRGRIDLAAGDVVYIGHLASRWPRANKESALGFSIRDQRAEAVKAIEDKLGGDGKILAVHLAVKLLGLPETMAWERDRP